MLMIKLPWVPGSQSQRMKNGGRNCEGEWNSKKERRGSGSIVQQPPSRLQWIWNHMFEGNERLGITFRLQTKIYRETYQSSHTSQ